MAKLISLVNNLAPGTAIDIEIHFPANLCKSVKETWLEIRIASTREINLCFLSERRQKACKRESKEKGRKKKQKPKKENAQKIREIRKQDEENKKCPNRRDFKTPDN